MEPFLTSNEILFMVFISDLVVAAGFFPTTIALLMNITVLGVGVSMQLGKYSMHEISLGYQRNSIQFLLLILFYCLKLSIVFGEFLDSSIYIELENCSILVIAIIYTLEIIY